MATKKQKQFDALKWVSQAAAIEAHHPVLTWAHYDAKTSTIACADGYRLFVARGVDSPDNLMEGQYLQLKKSVRNEKSEIGIFPDYNAIIPSGFNLSAFVVDVQHFTQAVKLANLFARDNNYSVRLDFYPESGQLRVSGRSNKRGDCETVIQIVPDGAYTFERLSVALNGRFILNALTGFEEKVLIQVKDHRSPIILGDLNAHFALIMPMSVSTERFGAKAETPAPPTIEPRDIGYRPAKSEYVKALDALLRKMKKQAKARGIGVQVGRDVREVYAKNYTPQDWLRLDIENALTLSASAFGSPRIAWDSERQMLSVQLRTVAFEWQQYADGRVQQRTRFTVGIKTNDRAYLGDRFYISLEWSREAVYTIALEWHLNRLVTSVLQTPAMRHTRKDIRGQFTHYRPNTGAMSALRKRARLLPEGSTLASVYFGVVTPRLESPATV